MRKTILVVAIAALALSGCGAKEPAPEVGVGEWSEAGDVAVRAWTAMDTLGIQLDIKNHRKSGDIDRHDIELKDISGGRVDADYAADSFEQVFVDPVPAGEEIEGTFYTATTDHSGASMTVTVDGQDYQFDLDPN